MNSLQHSGNPPLRYHGKAVKRLLMNLSNLAVGDICSTKAAESTNGSKVKGPIPVKKGLVGKCCSLWLWYWIASA